MISKNVFVLDCTQLNLSDVAELHGYKSFYKLLEVNKLHSNDERLTDEAVMVHDRQV